MARGGRRMGPASGARRGPRALELYEGLFECSDFKLQVRVEQLPASEVTYGPNPGRLRFIVNDLLRQTSKLRHYHYDTWTFIPDSRNDAVRKGMENFLHFPFLLMDFTPNKAGDITGLKWDLRPVW
jgi:hypothetical protein